MMKKSRGVFWSAVCRFQAPRMRGKMFICQSAWVMFSNRASQRAMAPWMTPRMGGRDSSLLAMSAWTWVGLATSQRSTKTPTPRAWSSETSSEMPF